MTTVPIEAFEARLSDLLDQVEQGETVVVTRAGKPVFDLVPRPRPRAGGLNLEAGYAYLRSKGITDPFPYVADDFDDPLPEDFLLRPLP